MSRKIIQSISPYFRFEKHCFFVFPQSKYIYIKEQNVPGYTFRTLNQDHFQRDKIFQENNRLKRYTDWLSEGFICFGFVDNKTNEIASYLWIAYSNKSEMSVSCSKSLKMKLTFGNAYIFDCRTAVEHQRKGLYCCGLLNSIQFCKSNNIHNIYIQCKSDNIASMNGIRSAGFHDIFMFWSIKLGFINIFNSAQKMFNLTANKTVELLPT